MFAKKMAGEAQEGDFGGAKRGDYTLQQPRMRDRDAESRETGLESLFNAAFSVSDAPQEVEQSQSQEEYEGFVPGLEISPPSSQTLLPVKPRREARDVAVRSPVPGLPLLRYFFLALVALGIGMVARQGWGQWSDVASFIWKVLNGSGTKAGTPQDPKGLYSLQDELGGEDS